MTVVSWWLFLFGGCAGGNAPVALTAGETPAALLRASARPAKDSVAVLVGAGDIAVCGGDGDEATAGLVDSLINAAGVPVTVFAAGDLAYSRGTARDFTRCYDPSWGRFKPITRPVPGNHEYKNGFLWFLFGGNADPYFAYFDSSPGQAGVSGDGWYRYELGTWQIFALNTGRKSLLRPNSRQWAWLEAELEANRSACSLVYLHNPRFSAGKHGDDGDLRGLWELLARHGTDLWLAGHDHNYQRFRPQTSVGEPDPQGIRQFVVGTGGAYLQQQRRETSGLLDRRTSDHYGVLKLTLRPGRYEWEFIVHGGGVWDGGSDACQNAR